MIDIAPPVNELPMPHADGVEHHFVTVDGIRLHVAEAGEGEPVVLLHGWPQHWWSWRELIGPLSERYRVICPDIRGMGWSDLPRTGYSLRRLLADLLGLMDALGLDRVRLVGHDWGSLIGYGACVWEPERIERFVPLGGVHLWSAAAGAPPLLYARPWHVYLLATPAGPRLVERIAVNRLHAWRQRGSFTPAETETYIAPLRRPLGGVATVGRDRQIVGHDNPYWIRHAPRARMRVKTLHLNGADDPLVRGLPASDNLRLELVPECGHFIAEERPGWLLDRLGAFL
jgi:pimeloyl-ACP methyl ester carboxylesterase